MQVSCLFVICIIIKDNGITIQSNAFHLSYMAVIIIHFKMKVPKAKKKEISEANNKV